HEVVRDELEFPVFGKGVHCTQSQRVVDAYPYALEGLRVERQRGALGKRRGTYPAYDDFFGDELCFVVHFLDLSEDAQTGARLESAACLYVSRYHSESVRGVRVGVRWDILNEHQVKLTERSFTAPKVCARRRFELERAPDVRACAAGA